MKKRMTLMVLAMAVLITAIGAVKYGQVKKAIAQHSSFQPPPEAVTTIVARQEQWPANLASIGTVAAVHGVTVSADLPGIVDQIHFDSGKAVRTGRRPRAAGHARGARATGGRGGAAEALPHQLRPGERPSPEGISPRRTTTRPRRRTRRAGPRSARSAPRSNGRPSGRRSPGSWESARSTSASTWPAARRSSRSSRSIRST